jgi:phosphoenolpyruvate-protein phosphotransferase
VSLTHDSNFCNFVSPLSGILVPIDSIPDPVFAGKMVGDGVGIDPTDNMLRAPIDGEVIQIHSSLHAITIRSDIDGTEILMHIGIDTVKLKGEGFKAKVKVGDKVQTGQDLIEFDMDFLAVKAKSLITPVLILNSDKEIHTTQDAFVNSKSDIIIKSHLLKSTTKDTTDKDFVTERTRQFTITNETGLHARPSALIASVAKKFQSNIKIIKYPSENSANAKSVVGIMGLEIQMNQNIIVEAKGSDAKVAIEHISEILEIGFHEHEEKSTPIKTKVILADEDENTLAGIPASPGLAVGNIFQIASSEIEVEDINSEPSVEKPKLEKALNEAIAELDSLRSKLTKEGNAERAAIFGAHLELLDDPDLIEECMNIIETKKSAAFAWKVSYLSHANRLTQLTNELFAARATDLKDVGRRVLKILVGAVDQKIDFPEDAILIAESLTPSDTANLDKSKVLGFATTTGGATSHVAILARSLGIPAIAGINAKALDLQAGTQVILDGDSGVIKLNISESDIALIKSKQEAYDKEKTQALEKAFDVAKTTDGLEIEVAANIAGPSDAADALSLGCDGVGLLRSEFLFLERKSAPTEADQLQTYQKIAHALTDEKSARKFIIRTLDVGGDKPLAYMPIPEEENPFLGERGIRVSLNNPEIFREQLRAILRVKPIEQVRIMFPMISTITELKEAKKILKEEQDKLGVKKIEVGIMIEVPSAALMAEQLAAEVDFFSIGANDLTQYTLAMDRGHHKLAALADGLHPSILRLIKMTCDGAKKHGKWVGVCGGIASDLPAVPILIGLGVTELSVSVPVLPMVKAQVRKISHKDCSELAQKALNLETGKEVRELVSSFNS